MRFGAYEIILIISVFIVLLSIQRYVDKTTSVNMDLKINIEKIEVGEPANTHDYGEEGDTGYTTSTKMV